MIYPAHAGINRDGIYIPWWGWIYPAHAGINHIPGLALLLLDHLPRTRGDKPDHYTAYFGVTESTPHTRG